MLTEIFTQSQIYMAGALRYGPVWLFVCIVFLLDMRYISAIQRNIEALLAAARLFLTERGHIDQYTESLATHNDTTTLSHSSVFDMRSLSGELAKWIDKDYFFQIFCSGKNFQNIFVLHLQEYIVILEWLLSGYSFIKQALKSFCLIGCVLCYLSLQFGAHHYDFTTMMIGFVVVHMIYFCVARARLLRCLIKDITGHNIPHKEPRPYSYGNTPGNTLLWKYGADLVLWLYRVVFHRGFLQVLLKEYWIVKSQHNAIASPQTSSQIFALSSRRFIREDKLRQDFSLFQILQGLCIVTLFLIDNYHRLALNYFS
ncbi:MAG: hypothetical protein OXC44_05375 [Proteobacteria bacterium]|nr:hypothetical protein [Pseudomonadota bacterium]